MNKILGGIAVAAFLAGTSLSVSAETFTNEHGDRVECHDEQVSAKDGHPIAAPVLGAVVGGVVGNQFGSGGGNKAATAVGVVGGAVAGKKIDENRTEKGGTTTKRVCRPAQ